MVECATRIMHDNCQCRPYFLRGSFNYLTVFNVKLGLILFIILFCLSVSFFFCQEAIHPVCVNLHHTHAYPTFMVTVIALLIECAKRLNPINSQHFLWWIEDVRARGDKICDCLPPCADIRYDPEVSYASFPGRGFNLTRTFKRLVQERNLSAGTDGTEYFKWVGFLFNNH